MMDAGIRKEILSMGDIHRSSIAAPERQINLYIGNNIMGACIDALGSMESFPDPVGIGITDVNHRRHYCKAYFGMEYKVPLLRHHFDVRWSDKTLLGGGLVPKNYTQHLNISNGTLSTGYRLYAGETSVADITLNQYFSFADQTDFHCDVHVVPFCEGVEVVFSVEAVTDYVTHYDFPYHGFSELIELEGQPALKISTGITWTVVAVPLEKGAKLEQGRETLSTCYSCEGETELHLGYVAANENYSPTPSQAVQRWLNTPDSLQRQRNQARWDVYWSKAMLDIRGAERLQTIWLRSLYYLGISEPDHPDNIGTPGGLAGSRCWPFAFPQDYCFVFQNFLSANHLEIAAGTASYWKEHLDDIVAFTGKLLKVDGAYIPWTLPNTNFKDFHGFGVPNKFSYELHNSGYAAHMCYTYYRFTRDEAYLYNVAVPVLTEIARFYQNISTYDPESGHYEILFQPITGQNEQGAHNQRNYLCCMTSAQYSIETAVKLYQMAGLTPEAGWEDIAEKKYAFDKVTVDGKMLSYEGADADEKVYAPVRLSGLALLPVKWLYESDTVKKAYLERYDWVRDAKNQRWCGWNLGELLVAGVRMRDDSEAQKDFDAFLATSQLENPYLDWEDVQIFETSGVKACCYFMTSHGLVSAALSEMAIQTFGEKCVLFPIVLRELKETGFGFDNYLTPFGCTVSASWKNGEITAELDAVRTGEITIELCHTSREHALYDDSGLLLCHSKNGELSCTITAGRRYRIVPV